MSSRNLMMELKQLVTAATTGTTSRYAGYAYGPDLSHYNQSVNVQTLVNNGVSYILQKISDGVQMSAGSVFDAATYKDPTADDRIQQAYNVTRKDGGKGIPCGLYHYMRFFPQKADRDRQIEYLLKNLTKSKVPGVSYHWVCIDIEGVRSDGGPVDTNTNIKDQAEAMYNALVDNIPGVPVVFYVNNNWLEKYSPALRDWLSYKGGEKNLHMAQWPWKGGITANWAALRSTYIPADTVRVLTPGYATWKWWQYVGDFNGLEGVSNSYDMNLYNGTTADLYAWLGFKGNGQTTPTEPPPVEPPADDDPPVSSAQLDRIEATLARIEANQNKPAPSVTISGTWTTTQN